MKLLEHFHELSLYPANAKELKGLILQLAVQGKLTAQWRKDNNDIEPANKLLKNIKVEKDIPFTLPKKWYWCKFINVAELRHGHQFRKHDFVEEGIPVVKIGQCKANGTLDLSNCNYIDFSRKDEFKDYLINKGDLLMALTGGTLGKVTRIDKNYGTVVQNYRVGNFFVNDEVLSLDFLNVILESDLFQGLVRERINQNAQPNIGKDNIEKILMPIPPLEEQKTIVKTVEQLFKEVEQLEQLTEERIQLKEQFAASALQELTINNTAKEWDFLQEHFHTFFNEEPNIKKFRETILQLAVQGKLTENWRTSHPELVEGDNSATALIEKIKAEKEQLIKEGKLKKEKPLPAIAEDDLPAGKAGIPYELPDSWVCCRLGDAINYGTTFKKESKETHHNVWVLELEDIEKESSRLLNKVRYEDRQFKSTKNVFEKGDVIYGKLRPYLDKVIIADEDGVCTTEMIPIKTLCGVSPEYVRWFLKNPEFIKYANSSTHGMNLPRLGTEKAKNAIFSLPPVNEQNTIVEKVNSLMALCNSLEQEVKESKVQVELLMKSVLREVFEP